MDAIIKNPYRIIGILSNSTEKDILKQKSKIKRFCEVGKEIVAEYDFPFFPPLQRTAAIIDKAFADIEQNQQKLNYSLYWFVKHNTIDGTAIRHLSNGNKEKAFEIWEKLTEEKEVNAKNFSAFNNIGTLCLLEDSKERIKQGIAAKIKMIESDYFTDFIQAVADENFSISSKKQVEFFIDELLRYFKNKFSITVIVSLFGGCTEKIRNLLAKKLTEELVLKIETQIKQSENKRSKNKINAYDFGIALSRSIKKEIDILKSILGKGNLQYKMLADNVAKELLQCSVDYFNESQVQKKSADCHQKAMELVKLAESFAINEVTKSRIEESINTLQDIKDRELIQAIEVLKSIKAAYERNKTKILRDVRKQELSLTPGEYINWDLVNETIEKSINWGKVVEVIKQEIPLKNIEKIKNSDRQNKLKEYRDLVDFVLEKLQYPYQKSQLRYLCYWKAVPTLGPLTTTPTVLPTNSGRPRDDSASNKTPTSSNKSSDNGGCLASDIIVGIIVLVIILMILFM